VEKSNQKWRQLQKLFKYLPKINNRNWEIFVQSGHPDEWSFFGSRGKNLGNIFFARKNSFVSYWQVSNCRNNAYEPVNEKKVLKPNLKRNHSIFSIVNSIHLNQINRARHLYIKVSDSAARLFLVQFTNTGEKCTKLIYQMNVQQTKCP
jgi:hypothetical protein